MMRGPCRILTDDTPSLRFSFNGEQMFARPGETLAAALLGNGITLVGRSFKYHRPRGIMAAGVEEPNALVTVGQGSLATPNTRATDVFVYDGLVARSQNSWPSLQFDIGAINGLLAPIFAAGFYYKTFFGPPKLWMFYERFIRRAAGLGPAPQQADTNGYEHCSAFCDVLVIGGGPAGLEAAHAAAVAGKRVILVEQDRLLGGSILRDGGDTSLIDAAYTAVAASGGKILCRTTATGVWDHDMVTLNELCSEPGVASASIAERHWHVRAAQVILATGAIERPITFANNDLPGVMLSRAVRSYIKRFAVLPGQQVVVLTNNDDGYLTADAVADAGGTVIAIVDLRKAEGSSVSRQTSGHSVIRGDYVIRAIGDASGVQALDLMVDGKPMRLPADLIAMSGGFSPVLHLFSHGRGKLIWREDIQAYVPGAIDQNISCFGEAAGDVPSVGRADTHLPKPKHSFIDFQNDVTAADIDLAWQEGYRSVEHLKRYTTLGMATDQGKTSNLPALARLASSANVDVPQAGLTTFRPPYTPVTLGALAGNDAGGHVAPERRLALHALHAAKDPIWQPLGYWHRPRAYPQHGETLHEAALREARAVRHSVGMIDVSTLAKFAIKGPDAAKFLEIVCATPVARLAVGRGRYTFNLREDGMVMDDGTVWRLAESEYLLTSSTGGAERMEAHLAYVRNVLVPKLRVSVVSQQEQYAGIAVAGPQSRAVIEALTGDAAPAHMGVARGKIAALDVLILAASYSGERAFEIYAAGDAALAVWTAIEDEVRSRGGYPYGLEAIEFLRIEKGHIVVGAEADGRTTPNDLRLEKMLNKASGYVGAQALTRPALQEHDRLQLVGLEAETGLIPEGAMLVTRTGAAVDGHVTSAALRLDKGNGIALALLKNGRARDGETLIATSPTRGIDMPVRVVAPHFYDIEGSRYRD